MRNQFTFKKLLTKNKFNNDLSKRNLSHNLKLIANANYSSKTFLSNKFLSNFLIIKSHILKLISKGLRWYPKSINKVKSFRCI